MDIAGRKYTETQSQNRRKRRNLRTGRRSAVGTDEEDRIAHYKRTKLNRNNFAKQYGANYGLRWRRIMDIIPDKPRPNPSQERRPALFFVSYPFHGLQLTGLIAIFLCIFNGLWLTRPNSVVYHGASLNITIEGGFP